MTQHFTQWDWAGYAAGQKEGPSYAAVSEHVRAGCASCRQDQEFWGVLGTTLAQESEPLPAGLRQRALAWATDAAQRNPLAGLSWEGYRLAFDSFMSPLPSTVRGLNARRHCVYELGSSAAPQGRVEVMVERVGSQEGWSIVGQVLNDQGHGWGSCGVDLAFGAVPAAPGATAPEAVRTNGFGEFTFARRQPGPWRLGVEIGAKRWDIAPLQLP